MSVWRRIQQDVVADNNNSSSTNLSASNSYTFTGTSISTLGIVGIQTSLYADKNCTVKVEQSPDGINWDLIDTYYYTASGNFGVTTQAISSYHRVVVYTANETTTTFRLQTALCPIVEAVPRSLDQNGNFKIASPVDSYGWGVENTPMGEMRIAEPIRLVGASFEGTTIDANFWTAVSGTGSNVSQGSSQILITAGTSSGGTATVYSTRRARYVGGSGMRFRALIQISAGTADNKRRWGIGYGSAMPTVTDGAWFQLDGTEFSVVICKGGVETKVTTFNGHYGTSYSLPTTILTYEIYWTNSKIYFVIGDTLLHLVSASSATWSSTMHFYAFMNSLNSGVISDVNIAARVITIYRLGKFETQPHYIRISTNTTTICKHGPGVLHRIAVNNPTNNTITVYDNTAGTGTPVIATIDPDSSATPFTLEYMCPFYNGLSIVTAGSPDLTVIFE